MAPRPDDPVMDPARAAALLAAARPDLGPLHLVHLGRGWDHDVYLANERVVCRFPRNAPAAAALALEGALLPWLAPRLPAPISAPLEQHPLPDHPAGWRFALHAWIAGETACDAALDDTARAALAPALGAFVRALHAVPVASAPVALPPDRLGRFDHARLGPPARESIAQLGRDGTLAPHVTRALLAALEDCPAPPPGDPPVIAHGDLHSRNVLVAPHGGLSGVIDWVDVHAGERAVDLAAAFEVLPPAAREAFFAAYGAVDPRVLARARWRAIDHASLALAGALARGDSRFARACHRALVEAAAPP